MIAVFLLYFALASRANHEWYMTWLLGPAFVGAGAAAERLGMRLAAFTMPLQIFTDRGYPVVTMSAQILIYLTLVAFAIPYLRDYASRWRARRPGGAGGPEVPSPHGSTEAVRRTARKR